MGIKKTYEVVAGPSPVDFRTYAQRTATDFSALLDSEPPAEGPVQEFLENHPSLVPCSQAPGGGTTASSVLGLIVTQPELRGFGGRRPDFLIFSADSARWYPTLIEIEPPSLRIYRRDGGLLAKFTQARNQLDQWRTWFADPINRQWFESHYGVPGWWVQRKTMKLRTVLVYGRRSEFEANPPKSKQRSFLLEGEKELMSFDRLHPDPSLRDAITVRAIGFGRFTAVAAPPTLMNGPHNAERLSGIDDLDRAIDRSEGWSPKRREFVKSRLEYWRIWAESASKNRGWLDANDYE